MIMFSVVTAVLGATFAAEALTAVPGGTRLRCGWPWMGWCAGRCPACPLTRQRPAASVAWQAIT
jgi:hypothetical protein